MRDGKTEPVSPLPLPSYNVVNVKILNVGTLS